MPILYIDGREYEARKGQTIIEVAFENGINIPHFCWHPELSVAGNCRMCLVEVGLVKRLADGSIQFDDNKKPIVNYFPKLQIACATEAVDGMFVRTNSPRVVKAQESVMEFLLINHPLDCPICDEAGQCKLQEYAFKHSTGFSRFDEQKVHKPKRVIWGPNIIFDAERCISCSRCIRFAKEIAKQDVLTFVQRGDHVTIQLHEGTQFDSPYSMNVIDICPVGALTSRDFRFKSRVWDMSFNDSICEGCARGCNIKIGVRNNEILRVEPRTNPYVNRFWMCDYGRLHYQYVNNNRVIHPYSRVENKLEKISLTDAIELAFQRLRAFHPSEIMFIGSAKTTNENNYLLVKLATEVFNTQNIDLFEHYDEKFGDDFLRCSDKTPNLRGARLVGVYPSETSISVNKLPEAIKSGKIKALYIIEDDFTEFPEIYELLDELDLIITHQYNFNLLTENADIIFPVTTFAEMEGTFVNIDNRVQHFAPALVTKNNLRYMGMKMSRLDKFGAHNDRWTKFELRDIHPSWYVFKLLANRFGSNWNYRKAEEVFMDISMNIEGFNGMTYKLLDEYYGIILGRAQNPEPKVPIYESHYMKP
ncbi:MAG: 2Fe-2S iron-sulfur cluster-binding protein [Ignavibacteria bacterium]|nr:2Fe-2S iron-sulfur cluster-binding protein [Ignavibacteria bacterium]